MVNIISAHKNRLTRCSIITLILLMLVPFFVPLIGFADTHEEPTLFAPHAILIDIETGTILYDKNAHEKTFPASTTKVMTALIVLETLDLDEVIHVDYKPSVGGSSMFIQPGESFTVYELLQAFLIRSANDAGEVFAKHISGTVPEFAKLMNERAAQLGALNTNFVNPHGMPNQNHVTTAYDLAVIAREAMQHEVFRDLVMTRNVSIPATGITPQRTYENTNRMLWAKGPRYQMNYKGQSVDIHYDPMNGIKTGYTNASRNCFIGSASFENDDFIAVVLNAHWREEMYSDARALMEYGSQNFHRINLAEAGTVETTIPVVRGNIAEMALLSDRSLSFILPHNILSSDIQKEITLTVPELTGPVEAGTELGQIAYYHNQVLLGETRLISRDSVEILPVAQRFPMSYYIIIIAVMLLISWQIYVFKIRRRRLKAYWHRRSLHYQQFKSSELQ